MSKPGVGGGLRPQFPLLGIVALLTGLLLIGLYFGKQFSTRDGELIAIVIYLGVGSILTLWGLHALASEIWPWIGRRRTNRRRVRMTSPALVYLLIMFTLFLGAMVGRQNILMLVFGLMAGPFVINGSITFQMLKGMRVQRRLPSRVMAGEIFSVDLQLDNRKRWLSSWMMFAQDNIQSTQERLEAVVLFTRVPPRSERSGSYQVRLLERGRYAFGPIQVASRYPLGLMERSIIIDQIDEVLVYPRIGTLSTNWHQQMAHSNELVHQPQSRKGAFDDEFHGLREYRGGDNPRAIHWRTSARRNTLMIREFHQARDQDLLVLLDLWIPPRPTPADRQRVELAVSFAASLCVEHCRNRGDAALLLGISGGESVLWQGPGSMASLDPVLERLALAEAGASRGLADLHRELRTQCGTATRKVVVTTRAAADPALVSLLHSADDGEQNGNGAPFRIVTATPQELESLIHMDIGP